MEPPNSYTLGNRNIEFSIDARETWFLKKYPTGQKYAIVSVWRLYFDRVAVRIQARKG